jgi:hypothetical protein
MAEENIVDLEKWKDSKLKRSKNEGYQSYLKSLPHSQLEIEMEQLDQYEDESFITKGQLILKEIASRAHLSVRRKIEKLSKDTPEN